MLGRFEVTGKKILCVADMLELGRSSKQLHAQIGEYCSLRSMDAVISFGNHAGLITSRIKALNTSIKVFHYKTQAGLIARLKRLWQKDSVVLLKGSRGTRMDRVVHWLMNY